MSYQVLARKWRPQTFADVVGQEHVLTALANGLSLGRIHHAYLFSGTRGVGKMELQAAGKNRYRQLLRLGRRQQKFNVRRPAAASRSI